MDTPIEECMRRDPKGLYAKAQAGQIKNFTGFQFPLRTSISPELHIHTVGCTPSQVADQVLASLRERQIITNMQR